MSTRADIVDAVTVAVSNNLAIPLSRVYKGTPEPAPQATQPYAIVKAFQPHEYRRLTMGTTGTVLEVWRCKVWVVLGKVDMPADRVEGVQYEYADKMRKATEDDLQGEAYNVYLEDARDNLDPEGADYYREIGSAPQLAYSIVIEEQKTANAVAS